MKPTEIRTGCGLDGGDWALRWTRSSLRAELDDRIDDEENEDND